MDSQRTNNPTFYTTLSSFSLLAFLQEKHCNKISYVAFIFLILRYFLIILLLNKIKIQKSTQNTFSGLVSQEGLGSTLTISLQVRSVPLSPLLSCYLPTDTLSGKLTQRIILNPHPSWARLSCVWVICCKALNLGYILLLISTDFLFFEKLFVSYSSSLCSDFW